MRARPGSGGARGHLARGGRARGTRAAAGHGARGGAAGLSLSSPAPLPLTSQGAGTYSFDTVRRAWRKKDDWALPFRGKAVRDDGHAGGCGLWFGISSAPGRRLCAADLATATASSPPEVRGVWEEFRPPGEWFFRNAAVVHLGSGRLCTVRFFATDPTDKLWKTRARAAPLHTDGVEPEHGAPS